MPCVHVEMIEIEEEKPNPFRNNNIFLNGFLNKKTFQRSHETSLPILHQTFLGVCCFHLWSGIEYLGNWDTFKEREEEGDGGREVFLRDSYAVVRNGDDGDGGDLFCG